MRLGNRAFDLLTFLIRRAGEVVPNAELLAQIWPNVHVEEGNLRVHVAALRKALGEGHGGIRYIANVAGRGYSFIAPVSREQPSSPALATQPLGRATNLPPSLTGIIGRTEVIAALTTQLKARRFLTIVGPGGIGKTTVALAIAEAMMGSYVHGVRFVGLGSLADPALVPATVMSALEKTTTGPDVMMSLCAALRDKHLLIVLDNCEHVVEASAALAEALLKAAPGLSLLATSREALRAEGERVHRLSSLAVPTDAAPLTAAEAVAFSAVQLFNHRATASTDDFTLTDDNVARVVEICRRLDGIPLALELAAARVSTHGVAGLAGLIDDRMMLAARGRRTALPRHQTLRAALDWSYGLLSEVEQAFFRRLGIFSGGFTVEAAAAIATHGSDASFEAVNYLADLEEKSLVVADIGDSRPRFRLLETTRSYALERLAQNGEAPQIARRHGEFYARFFARFTIEGLSRTSAPLNVHGPDVDNLRGALNWAFSASGDPTLGVELAAAAADFWIAISVIAEAREWAHKGLATLGPAAGTRGEMVLQCSFGMTSIYSQGMNAQARQALSRALELARTFKDFDYQQRSTYGLWLFSGRSMALTAALAVARDYEAVARDRDAQSRATAAWLIGVSQTYLGVHTEASQRLRSAIDQYPVERRDTDMVRLSADLRASALGHLALNLLSRGLLDAAAQAAAEAIQEARIMKSPVVLCLALTTAAGIVFPRLGVLDQATRYADELVDCADKHSLRPFHAIGLCARGTVRTAEADHWTALALLRSGLADMQAAGYLLFYPAFQAELAAALGAAGRVEDGLEAIDLALRFAVETNYQWYMPEILRTKAVLLARHDRRDPAAIIDLLRRSIAQAQAQEALYWELRAAISLARVMREAGDARAGADCLRPVYDRFTEGFGTSDLEAAKALLTSAPVD